jgi:hypothetical protein
VNYTDLTSLAAQLAIRGESYESRLAAMLAVLAVTATVLLVGLTSPVGATTNSTHATSAVAAAAVSNPPCGVKSPLTSQFRVVPNVGWRLVMYCPTWVPNAPVIAGSASHGNATQIGTIRMPGTNNNWFICHSLGVSRNYDYAFTEGDNGAWGWVSAWDYAGAASVWPLPACDSAITLAYGVVPDVGGH